MARTVLVAAALLLALQAASAETAPEKCTLIIISALDTEMEDHGLVTVPVTLNDKPFHMLVDTGDYYSVLLDHTVKALGMRSERSTGFELRGWGGRVIDHFTEVQNFGLGRLRRGRTQFMVEKDDGDAFDGLFGADFLYYFDLDFDFAKAKLNLISPDHCKGKAVYWSKGNFGAVPFDYRERAIRLTIVLDGKEVQAILDTGASDTVMSLEKAASLFDIDEKVLAERRDRYPFKKLSFGEVDVTNPAITLVPDDRSRMFGATGPQIILGMGILRRLHLYISYKEEMIYVTPATQY